MKKKGQETGNLMLYLLIGAALLIIILVLIGVWTGLIPKALQGLAEALKFW